MIKRTIRWIAPLWVFLAFLLDVQLSTLMLNLIPGAVSIASLLVLIVPFYFTAYLSRTYVMTLYMGLGLVYDIYYFDVVGLSLTLFPLVIYLLYYFYDHLRLNVFTNLILLIVLVFLFLMLTYGLARIFGLTNLSLFLVVFYYVVPTLVWNSLLFLILNPILSRLFSH